MIMEDRLAVIVGVVQGEEGVVGCVSCTGDQFTVRIGDRFKTIILLMMTTMTWNIDYYAIIVS